MKRYSKLKHAAWLIAFAASAPLHASGTNGFGKITGVSGLGNGAVLFSVEMVVNDAQAKIRRVTQSRDAPPPCGAAQPNRWAIDASTIVGQAQLTTLLWALDHSRPVSVVGAGRCSIAEDTETVSKLTIQDAD